MNEERRANPHGQAAVLQVLKHETARKQHAAKAFQHIFVTHTRLSARVAH
jgi:hypothetical protein